MDQGGLPHLSRLRQVGGYRPLGTSIPPQSPVAWANFITGADAGVHGIFDFIHRDPKKQCMPYFAMSQTVEAEQGWEVGEHRIPLTFWPFNHRPAETLLRRAGVPFWDYLDAAGIPAWVYDIPSNYPPSPSEHGHQFCLSGMGTPDLLGTQGTYQWFSSRRRRVKNEGGGMRKPLRFKNDTATATLTGPRNTLLKKPVDAEVEFQVHRHPREPLARIELQGRTIILKEGEWSDWQKVAFPLEMPAFLPNDEVAGICRFYLQEVRPHFRLYVSPINVDPSDPAQRVSEPAEFVTKISDELGLFYTTGFQEDHKARRHNVFTDEEYLEQANYVLAERMNLLGYALEHYQDGLLFFYFSSTDLQAHMFWWDSDEKHPIRSPDDAKKYYGVLAELYGKMDAVVGDVLKRYGDKATILVMSDHGFCNFRRQFHLNTWLRDNGYLGPPDCETLLYDPGRPHKVLVDWTRTRAYGLGINSLYLNLRGRERDGIVDPAERDVLLEELRAKLLAVRDPLDGQPAISEVHRGDQAYAGPLVHRAPDLIIGYRRGYRSSWDTALGGIAAEVFSDNKEAWSADHCMATGELPGVVFSNRPILHEQPALIDLAPTILEEFGLTPPRTMVGRSLFKSA